MTPTGAAAAPAGGPAARWDPAGGATFVKICGITSLADARAAVRAGANALGFVFAPSPRRVEVAQAAEMAGHLHPSVARVGVFVDAPLSVVLGVATGVGLDWVQLQGSEDHSYLADLRRAHPGLCVVKAIRLTGPDALAGALAFPADAVMLDSKDARRPEVAQASLPSAWLAGAQALVAPGVRLIVAGGLTAASVAGVVARVRPWGVDVSGGVEEAPGRKDAVKMGEFVQAVRSAQGAAG